MWLLFSGRACVCNLNTEKTIPSEKKTTKEEKENEEDRRKRKNDTHLHTYRHTIINKTIDVFENAILFCCCCFDFITYHLIGINFFIFFN